MKIKTIDDENFNHYKKPSMVIGFPNCTFKCEKECGKQVCQNGVLATSPNIEMSIIDICKRYMGNNLTSALVCAGLEPFDSWDDLLQFVKYIRVSITDDIVIYTGYYKHEIEYKVNQLAKYDNVIIKFGRFIPGQQKHYDEVLGVYLASDNQYGERIS